jgi:hypothetical protein
MDHPAPAHAPKGDARKDDAVPYERVLPDQPLDVEATVMTTCPVQRARQPSARIDSWNPPARRHERTCSHCPLQRVWCRIGADGEAGIGTHAMVVSIFLMGGGTIVVALTFLWERSIIRAAVKTAVDETFAAHKTDPAELDELGRKFEMERNTMEWIRVFGAIMMLVGIIWNWL